MRQISRPTALGLIAVAAVIAVLDGEAAWRAARAEAILGIDASIVAVSIPGASTIGQIGTFLSTGTLTPGNCANPMPIPKNFPTYTLPGKVLNPNRILVGSRSNFGAQLPASGGLKGSLLSIDPSGRFTLVVPANFDSNGDQEATLGGAVQMFSANSQHWLNGMNNPHDTPLSTPASAIRWVSRTTTGLGVSGRPIRLSA